MSERDWRKCPTHPDVDGAHMWGCPDCVVELRREVEALRTALRPFAERAEWTIASTAVERLHDVSDDDVLPVPRLACRRAADVLGVAPERALKNATDEAGGAR